MNVLEAQAHRLPARRAKCRLGENGKEQAVGAKEELEIMKTGADEHRSKLTPARTAIRAAVRLKARRLPSARGGRLA